MVPTFIMIAPAFMVPDNRLSPYVEDLAANEKNASRACEVIEIPSGIRGTLPAGAVVRIMSSLAGSYTVGYRSHVPC